MSQSSYRVIGLREVLDGQSGNVAVEARLAEVSDNGGVTLKSVTVLFNGEAPVKSGTEVLSVAGLEFGKTYQMRFQLLTDESLSAAKAPVVDVVPPTATVAPIAQVKMVVDDKKK